MKVASNLIKYEPKCDLNNFEIVHKFVFNFLSSCLKLDHATFNNISAIPWQSVLLAEETGVPGENHRPVASH